MIRIILTFVMLLTASMLPFPVSGQSDNGEYPVWFNDEVYIVDDPDGYANMRSGPGSKHRIVRLCRNKELLCRDKNKKIVDGWVPIYSYHDSTSYIHISRLLPMEKPIAEKISVYAAENMVFAVGRNFPNIVVINWSEGAWDVVDLKIVDFTAPNSDKTGYILPYFENLGVMWGDTLSFYTYKDDRYDQKFLYQCLKDAPSFTVYKLYHKGGGRVGYTTQHFPEMQKTAKPGKTTPLAPERWNDATFIVDDPDGYVNMRTGPGSSYESTTIMNQTVVQRNKEAKVANGWIPVIAGFSEGYIYQDRLRTVDLSVVPILDTLYHPPTWRPTRFAYSAGKDYPKLFVIENHHNRLQLLDIHTGKDFFPYLEYFGAIEGDPMTFYALHHYSDYFCYPNDLYPMLALYKLYHKNGKTDYYTEIFPQPRKISRDQAEAIVKTARYVLARECNGNMQKFKKHLDFMKHCGLLFLAYCSGVDDALKVVDFQELPYEIKNMVDAYQRSQYKLKR